MNKKFKIKIDRGDEIEILHMWFEDEIAALEYCEKKTTSDVRYILL